jgi:GTPase SAR1 family protein
MAKALGNYDYEEIFDQRVGQAQKMQRCDLKLIICGDSAVGKSKLVERFLLDDYEERTSSTHALTMFRYNYTISNKTYKVGKWQTNFEKSKHGP